MTGEPQFHEAIERCVSIMVFYHQAERSREVELWVTEAIRAVGHWLGDMEQEAIGTRRGIVLPVEDALIERYGYEVGPRLTSFFVHALESSGAALGPA